MQVYIGAVQPAAIRPEKELKEFAKVFLKAGESQKVNFTLDARAFSVYDAAEAGWVVPGGAYKIWVGASSRDIRLQDEVKIQGRAVQAAPKISGWYTKPTGKATQADFESLLGKRIEPVKLWRRGSYTLECSFLDMKDSFVIQQVVKNIEKTIAKSFGGADYSNPTFKMIVSSSTHTPMKNLSQLRPDRMPRHVTMGLVHLANGSYIKGILALTRKPKEKEA